MTTFSVRQALAHLRTPLYRNAYALTVSTALTSVLGLLFWFLAARLYPADIVGLNSAAIAAMLFLAGVAGLYLDGVLIRFAPRAGRATRKLVGSAYLVSGGVAALASLVFLAGVDVWAPALGFLRADPWLGLAFVVGTVASCLAVVQEGALTGMRQATWTPLQSGAISLAKLGLLAALAHVWPKSGLFVAWTVATVVVLLPMNIWLFQRLIPQHSQAGLALTTPVTGRQVTGYLAGNYLAYLCNVAGMRLVPLLVIQLAGSQANAYFYLPWIITSTLRLVPTNLSVSLVAEGACEQGKLGQYGRQALAHSARLMVPTVAGLVVASPFLLNLFGRDYASEGTLTLRLLVLGTLPNMVCVLYIGLARVRQHIRRIVVIQALLLAGLLGLSLVWLPRYGIVGVGLAWLVSQSLVAVGLLCVQFIVQFIQKDIRNAY